MRTTWAVRLLAAVAVVLTALLATSTAASAHPLGNFTTNRYARIEVGAAVVRIHYVLDEAELVAFRSRDEVQRDREGFTAGRVEAIRDGLRLDVDGEIVALQPVRSRLTEPAGQGGLRTLRLEVVYEGALPSSGSGDDVAVSFEDTNQPERVGWREVVVRGVDGARISSSSAPADDRTDGLRSYPEDPAAAPLDVRVATFRFAPGSGTDAPATLDEARVGGIGGDRFLRLLDSTGSSPLAVAGAIVVALAFGAVHAVGPGHGKTVMAAYLVSTSGRRRDAVALGVVVSLMHTASVLALATALATFGREVRADRLYPGLTVAAGLLVVAVGLQLLRRRVAARSALRVRTVDAVAVPAMAGASANGLHGHAPDEHVHAGHDHHEHDHHEHDHGSGGHGHEHGPGGHTHELPAGVRPLSRAGLLALGTSGGLFPSPSAVVVLVGAFAIGRSALGLALIAAFSVGLAAVLVGVGLLLVAGRDRIVASRLSGTVTWLPLAGAAAITLLGLVLVAQGVVALR